MTDMVLDILYIDTINIPQPSSVAVVTHKDTEFPTSFHLDNELTITQKAYIVQIDSKKCISFSFSFIEKYNSEFSVDFTESEWYFDLRTEDVEEFELRVRKHRPCDCCGYRTHTQHIGRYFKWNIPNTISESIPYDNLRKNRYLTICDKCLSTIISTLSQNHKQTIATMTATNI